MLFDLAPLLAGIAIWRWYLPVRSPIGSLLKSFREYMSNFPQKASNVIMAWEAVVYDQEVCLDEEYPE